MFDKLVIELWLLYIPQCNSILIPCFHYFNLWSLIALVHLLLLAEYRVFIFVLTFFLQYQEFKMVCCWCRSLNNIFNFTASFLWIICSCSCSLCWCSGIKFKKLNLSKDIKFKKLNIDLIIILNHVVQI